MSLASTRFEVKFAGPEDYEKINSLFNLCFGKQRSVDEFAWKFLGSPWVSDLPVAVVAEVEGRIVGSFGLLPHRLSVYGASVDVVQVVDVCVHPKFQRCGVNRTTLNFFLKEGRRFSSCIFGFPGPVYAALGFEKLGFRRLTAIRAYAWNWQAGINVGPVTTPSVITIEDSLRIASDWGQFLSEQQRGFQISTDRSLDYLRWRYEAGLQGQFTFLTARRSGVVEGLVVARMGLEEGAAAIWIYELLAVRAEVVTALVKHLISIHSSHPPPEILYWCSEHAPWQDELQSLGFRQTESGPGHAVFMLLEGAKPQLECHFNPSEWFLTLGDTDL